jgi:hypothetical protein
VVLVTNSASNSICAAVDDAVTGRGRDEERPVAGGSDEISTASGDAGHRAGVLAGNGPRESAAGLMASLPAPRR